MRVDVPKLLARLGIEAERRGKEYWARCPLHDERTASFQIHDEPGRPKHGNWRCLGACHTGGNALDLVASVLKLDDAEARAWVREGGEVEVDPEQVTRPLVFADRESRSEFELPRCVVFTPFPDWPRAPRDYLTSRGVTAEQVARWGIGYAVDGRLAGRIVFPWRDQTGLVYGYTARAFLPTVRKHDEPTEADGAIRGFVLGEQHWPQPNRRSTVVVVEGMFDGLAVERATGCAFGAARGSNLLPEHADKFATFEEVVVASDPDPAGRGYATSLRASLGRYVRFRVAELPTGTDPAKLAVRAGLGALADALRLPRAAA